MVRITVRVTVRVRHFFTSVECEVVMVGRGSIWILSP